MQTLGRFEKFNTWPNQIFEEIEKRIKNKSWWVYLVLINTCHIVWKNGNVLQKWGYVLYFCMKFQVKNDNAIRKINPQKFENSITFARAL
jgi:hypothetical protein